MREKFRSRSILPLGLKIIVTFMMIANIIFPTVALAGSLEPLESPGPTMKTLDEIPPTWSQKLPATERFVLVLDDQAVLDKETGLVWERSPSTTPKHWNSLLGNDLSIGGRKGWRLPTLVEFQSLIDPAQTRLALPPGHPFKNVQEGIYWTSTTADLDSLLPAFVVDLRWGNYGSTDIDHDNCYLWCVRGGCGHTIVIPK